MAIITLSPVIMNFLYSWQETSYLEKFRLTSYISTTIKRISSFASLTLEEEILYNSQVNEDAAELRKEAG